MSAESSDWLLYGATGRTGRRIAEAAVARGMRPRLCARDPARLHALAQRLELDACVADVTRPAELHDALRGARFVINAAGPFSRTTSAWIAVCLAARTHYLDISGELDALVSVANVHAAAQASGLMFMPAVGFDVVASDCLALHAFRRLPDASRLRLGFARLGPPSRGSARSIVQEAWRPTRVRRDGRLEAIAPGGLQHRFDFGRGPSNAFAVSWGDNVTAYYTTGVSNIESYFEATSLLRWAVAMQPLTRVLQEELVAEAFAWQIATLSREPVGPVIVAELEDGAGRCVRSRLTTPDVYAVTVESSLAIAARVLAGDLEPGFQTPARVYGADFVLGLPGVTREDL